MNEQSNMSSGYNPSIYFTAEVISFLACELLAPKPGDSLYDLGCANGRFLFKADYLVAEDVFFIGVESAASPFADPPDNYTPQLYPNLFYDPWTNTTSSREYKIFNDDIFEFCNDAVAKSGGRRMVLCQPTPAVPMNSFIGSKRMANKVCYEYFGILPKTTEWYYLAAVLKLMREEGRGVVILPTQALVRVKDRPVREAIVKNGYLECIMQLPAETSNVGACPPLSLLVLSRDNSQVRVVDATEQNVKCEDENLSIREKHYFWSSIIELTQRDSYNSQELSNDQIAEAGYKLSAEELLKSKTSGHPTKTLRELGTLVTGMPKSKFDKLCNQTAEFDAENPSRAPTIISRFTLNDIEAGEIIDGDEPSPLFIYDEGQIWPKRDLHQEGSLLISRTGYPFKIAYVRAMDYAESFTSSDNIFCYKPTDKINPIYLLGYLSSNRGQKELDLLTKNKQVKQLTTRDLRELAIPLPSKKIQDKIAEEHLLKLKSTQRLKSEISANKHYTNSLYANI